MAHNLGSISVPISQVDGGSALFPSPPFLLFVRQQLSSSRTRRICVPKIGFSSFSSSYSQILECTSLAYDFADALSCFSSEDEGRGEKDGRVGLTGRCGDRNARISKTSIEYGYALNLELKTLLGQVIQEVKLEEKQRHGSSRGVHFSELGCKVNIRIEVQTIRRPSFLRPSKEVMAIYICLSPTHSKEKDGERPKEQMIGCWKWSIARLGRCNFFWGKDLSFNEEKKCWFRSWLCWGEDDSEAELRPLLS